MAAVSQYVGDTVSGTVTWVPCFGRENPASEDLYFSQGRNLCLVRHDEVFLYTICTQPPIKVITKKQIIGQPEKDDLKIIKVSFPLNRPCEEKKKWGSRQQVKKCMREKSYKFATRISSVLHLPHHGQPKNNRHRH